jgi:hypothetical protein
MWSNLWRFVNAPNKMFWFRIVFWDVLPCKIIVDQRFRGAYCLHHPWSLIIILHGSTSQKTILNIILAAVKTWNLTKYFGLSMVFSFFVHLLRFINLDKRDFTVFCYYSLFHSVMFVCRWVMMWLAVDWEVRVQIPIENVVFFFIIACLKWPWMGTGGSLGLKWWSMKLTIHFQVKNT